MGLTADSQAYVRDLEEYLGKVLFDAAGAAESEAAVLLVRGALASGNRARAAWLAQATEDLAQARPADADLMAAAAHARGLLEHDPAALELAAVAYSAPLAKAAAIEDAGWASSVQGDQNHSVAGLRRAYEQYEKLGRTEEMARVRSHLRVAGVRVRHRKCAERPTFGWGSLTKTERRVAELVSEGLSNREVANQIFLSPHTVAFHLRHIFCKLDVSSRVQLATLVTEKTMPEPSLSVRR